MSQTPAYAVVRVHADSYRLDRLTLPGAGAAAFVLRFRDRLGNPLGWRLRPLVVMQGAKSRIHPTAAQAVASTKLFTLRTAQDAVEQANAVSATGAADGVPELPGAAGPALPPPVRARVRRPRRPRPAGHGLGPAEAVPGADLGRPARQALAGNGPARAAAAGLHGSNAGPGAGRPALADAARSQRRCPGTRCPSPFPSDTRAVQRRRHPAGRAAPPHRAGQRGREPYPLHAAGRGRAGGRGDRPRVGGRRAGRAERNAQGIHDPRQPGATEPRS